MTHRGPTDFRRYDYDTETKAMFHQCVFMLDKGQSIETMILDARGDINNPKPFPLHELKKMFSECTFIDHEGNIMQQL